MSKPVIWMVIPCYNEEEVLTETAKRLKGVFSGMVAQNTISPDSKILFVDDGSKDSTWNIICELFNNDFVYSGIKLAHNKGHQNAVLAGLMTAKEYCDAAISMDADLQDDISVIPEMVEKFIEGKNIVYGVRSDRSSDSVFKRTTANMFYNVMDSIGSETIKNHADFRLMDKKSLEALSDYPEINLFLRGIVPTIGLDYDCVYYERKERFAGVTKYPFKKMVDLAVNGISSFSVKPLRFAFAFGVIATLIGIIMFIVALCIRPIIGWLMVSSAIWFVGGVQFVALGVIGEYVGKTYLETKRRPRYIIEQSLLKGKESDDR